MPSSDNDLPRVAAVLLAAGESARMHEMKALLPWVSGRPLLAYQAQTLRDAGFNPIVTVLGHLADRLRQEVASMAHVEVVENPRYPGGTLDLHRDRVAHAAVRRRGGAHHIGRPAALRWIADVSLREAWLIARPAVAVPSLDGHAGHPPLFDAALLPELLSVTEERQGLREVVSRHRDERLLVPVDDPLTLTNLNTRAEYEAALELAQA